MTLSEIRASEKPYLTPTDVAPVLKCHPYALNVTVNSGGTLPFPNFKIGNRLKIPRAGFLAWADKNGIGGTENG